MSRNSRSSLFSALIIFLLAVTAFAQSSGRISGRVTKTDGGGAGGVVVLINELSLAGVTDQNGNYSLEGVPAGSHTVLFTAGDNSDSAPVEVSAGGTTTLDKSVDWQMSFAESITVFSASRRTERIVEAPAAITSVSIEEINREAGSGQATRLVENAPGVDFAQSGLYDTNFSTRGFNSSLNRRILTLVDGRDPSVPFLGAQEWAALSYPVDEFQSVELVRGPGSALYGANAFSGVLNMVTRQPRYHQGGKFQLTGGDLSTLRIDLRQAGALGAEAYYRVIGGYQQSDDFTRSRNVDVREYCSTATECGGFILPREAVPLALNEDQIAFGGFRLDKYFGSSNLLTFEGGTAVLEGPTFQTGIGRVQTTDVERPWARANFNALHWNLLTYYDTRKAEDQVALASGARLFEDSSNLHAELQTNWDFFAGKARVVGGVAYHEQDIDTANPAGFQTLMTEARNEDQQAVFGQLELNFSEKLKAVVAARYDESTLHESQTSPKASLVYSVTPNHSVRLNYNEAFQVPNYSEFFLRAPAGAPVTALAPLEAALAPLLGGIPLGFGSIPVLALGNSLLEVEEITAYEIGYSGILGSKLFMTLDVYHNQTENFVTDLLPGVNPAFGAYQPPAGLSAMAQGAILQQLALRLPPANRAALTNLANGSPAFVVSYTNAGEVESNGAELAMNFYVTNSWVLDFNYSWFEFDVKSTRLGDVLLPNAPENKVNLGLSYRTPAFDASVKYRWVDDFQWATGVFNGPVPSYNTINASANFHFLERYTVGLNATNVLDDEHYESFGGDILERRALGYVGVTW